MWIPALIMFSLALIMFSLVSHSFQSCMWWALSTWLGTACPHGQALPGGCRLSGILFVYSKEFHYQNRGAFRPSWPNGWALPTVRHCLPAWSGTACVHGGALPTWSGTACSHGWALPTQSGTACPHGQALPAQSSTACLHGWAMPAWLGTASPHGQALPAQSGTAASMVALPTWLGSVHMGEMTPAEGYHTSYTVYTYLLLLANCVMHTCSKWRSFLQMPMPAPSSLWLHWTQCIFHSWEIP